MLEVKDIVNVSGGKLLNGVENTTPKSYEFDSRKAEKGTFFIPIKGENTDGHKYIVECVKKGGIGFLIQREIEDKDKIIKESIEINSNVLIIEVEDTKKTFFLMGEKNREKHINIPIVAITGSVGKTSTREMISNVLEIKYNVLKTEQNYNSHIGIPYMLLKMDKQDLCVIEVGIDKIGEMKESSNAVKPDIAIITNIGLSHVENFGSLDVTYREKIKICDGLNPGGICIVNGDDERLAHMQENYKGNLIKYGIKNDDVYKIDKINVKEYNVEFEIRSEKEKENIVINDIGNHNVSNAMAAVKVGQLFNMNINQIKQGIANYRNFEKRMSKQNIKNKSIVINDAYNASYDSVMSGLETINKIPSEKKIVIIGDILELGNYSKDTHSKIGENVNEFNIDIVITYGKSSEGIYDNINNKRIRKYKAENKEEILEIVDKEMVENTLIYVKASNGMKLYEVSDEIIKRYK